MAGTEMTVSMSDIGTQKTKEEDEVAAESSSKTQIILQLQPVTTGVCDESDIMDKTLEAEEDVELGYPITCGESKAILLFEKFVCPGINVKCIKYEDQLISPKQFVHMSGKAALKDWKRAIRIDGHILRKIMDSGQLDFYQHSTLCTNTCRSTKFDLLINNTRFPPDSSVLSSPASAQGQLTLGNGGKVDLIEEKPEEEAGERGMDNIEKQEVHEISEETLTFWRGIADVGLMGEVVSNIQTELLQMLQEVQLNANPVNLHDSEVAVLSNLTHVFGLLDSIKRIVSIRRQITDPGSKHILKSLTSLEQQLEEQRRQQAQFWLNSFSSSSPRPAKRANKRPRLRRPASATLLPPLTLQPPQFTVLSPITLSSVCQPITVTSLAQTPSTVTLFTHVPPLCESKPETLTLLETVATQESTHLGAVELETAGTVNMVGTVLGQEHESQTFRIDLQDEEEEEQKRRKMDGVEEGEGMAEGETVELVQPETEELCLEANGQIQNLQILVVEDEEELQVENKP